MHYFHRYLHLLHQYWQKWALAELIHILQQQLEGQANISAITKKSWVFLLLSGLSTGASWLCYYKALQVGEASKVVPIDKLSVVITLFLAFIFLHEQFTIKSLVGAFLITIGTFVIVL